MKLPNYQSAVVPMEKLENYLLSEIHPVGRAKALFLKNLGYDINNAEVLSRDLLSLAQNEDIADVQASEYGTKYIIDGLIQTPSAVVVALRTV